MAKVKKHVWLDPDLRHFGTYRNFRHGRIATETPDGKPTLPTEFAAYLEYQDDGKQMRGFALVDKATRKEFKPGLLLVEEADIAKNRINFTLDGKTEPADKDHAGKVESKSERNKRMQAAA